MGSRPSRARATVAPVQTDPTQSEGSPRKHISGTRERQSGQSVSSEEDSSPADSGSEYEVVAENFQIYKVELLEERLAEAEGRLKDAEERNRRAEQVSSYSVRFDSGEDCSFRSDPTAQLHVFSYHSHVNRLVSHYSVINFILLSWLPDLQLLHLNIELK